MHSCLGFSCPQEEAGDSDSWTNAGEASQVRSDCMKSPLPLPRVRFNMRWVQTAVLASQSRFPPFPWLPCGTLLLCLEVPLTPPPGPLSRDQGLAWAQDPCGLWEPPLCLAGPRASPKWLWPQREMKGEQQAHDVLKDCHGNSAGPGQLAGASLAETQAWPPTRAGLAWGAEAMWGGWGPPTPHVTGLCPF